MIVGFVMIVNIIMKTFAKALPKVKPTITLMGIPDFMVFPNMR